MFYALPMSWIQPTLRFCRVALCTALLAQPLSAATRPACPPGVNPTDSKPLEAVTADSGCVLKTRKGFKLPDPACTPGATNPTVDLTVLQSGKFKTGCERDTASSSTEKRTTYGAYKLKRPTPNNGQKQTCELDHLVSLELGGADTLDNIWPQCGPSGVSLAKRYFKIKDGVENYLARKVRSGEISLTDAQRGIASDWTQYIDESVAHWSAHKPQGFGRDSTSSDQ
jgi:hypothetical protein